MKFLETPTKKLAYNEIDGRSPTVLFLHGFRSDMEGSKALALEAFCKEQGQRFIRFDCQGHGASSGKFSDCTIGTWMFDVLDVLDSLINDRVVLVGSSMGGWLALLAALERPEKIAGIVGIAAAPDFTENLMWEKLTPKQKKTLQEKGSIQVVGDYDSTPYTLSMRLIEEARDHLLLSDEIDIHCPVHLIHGIKDEDVPWEVSFSINEKLATKDVKTTLIESGDHRLSTPENLQSITKIVRKMLARVD